MLCAVILCCTSSSWLRKVNLPQTNLWHKNFSTPSACPSVVRFLCFCLNYRSYVGPGRVGSYTAYWDGHSVLCLLYAGRQDLDAHRLEP